MNLSPKFHQYRYSFLYFSLIVMLIVSPYIERSFFWPIFILLLLVGILGTLELRKIWFQFCVGLGFIASLSHVVLNFELTDILCADTRFVLLIFYLSAYALFLGIAIITLGKKMFTEAKVTADTIRGGIAIYLLMGIFWAFLYQLLLSFDASALSNADERRQFFAVMYFSFTTLTTLGYGDIAPVTVQARSLAMLEAIIGPVYLTVFIARLVSIQLIFSNADDSLVSKK